jgi:hypothetical protein
LAPQTMPRLFTSGIVGSVEPKQETRSDCASITPTHHRTLILVKVPCSIALVSSACRRSENSPPTRRAVGWHNECDGCLGNFPRECTPDSRHANGARSFDLGVSTPQVRSTMRSLAVVALLIGGTSHALAQNLPPTNGYPPPAPGTSGTPATYGPPAPGIIPGAPGPVYSHHYRYWWPQGQYHWRWGYWCERGRGRQINCGVPR